MDIESFRDLCLSFKGVTEEFPFDSNTLVFKVGGKMFALTDVDLFTSINLKCDPEEAVSLRERYPGILPGYHMNKRHWNTVLMDGTVPDRLVEDMICESYSLVLNGLPGKKRENLEI